MSAPDLGMTHQEFLEPLHAPGENDAVAPEFLVDELTCGHAAREKPSNPVSLLGF
ncbi:hypothetical protein [Corallococcus exercitus]|uniref:Uncharacterized protein n=1 Tax=Corallococcus exercitus TaxID=2316736 RepID=A0A7Y4JP27_9BACT|nr:hypothetical protein [Corallococcus exercitus]NOK08541.1 hypothetical protein [Corallococcus exercitus]